MNEKRKKVVRRADARAFGPGVEFPERFTTHTPKGNPVHVHYRRVPTRDGHDIEAIIISGPRPKQGESK